MIAERPAPTGAYDFTALAREGVGRVLHYQQVPPVQADQPASNDQPQPANAVAPGPSWQPVSDEYAIGFARDLRNDNGGVAIGYGSAPSGTIGRAACGGFVWATGERLRVTDDQALAARLATGGPAVVNSLQGNVLDAVRPANVPPLQTYFADYDDQFADAAARGHMGDIAIWRVCGAGTGTQALVPTFPAPSLLVPVGFCRRGEIRLPGGECCDRRFVRYGRCGCPPGAVRRDPPAGWPVLRPAPGPQRSVLRARRDRMRRDAVPERQVMVDGRCCEPQAIHNGHCTQRPHHETCRRGEVLIHGVCRAPPPVVLPPRRHFGPPRVRPPHREPRRGTHWTHRVPSRTPHIQPRPGLHFGGGGRHQ